MKYFDYALAGIGGFALGIMLANASGKWEVAVTVFGTTVLLRLALKANAL